MAATPPPPPPPPLASTTHAADCGLLTVQYSIHGEGQRAHVLASCQRGRKGPVLFSELTTHFFAVTYPPTPQPFEITDHPPQINDSFPIINASCMVSSFLFLISVPPPTWHQRSLVIPGTTHPPLNTVCPSIHCSP
ncbi:hypothetical protein Pcinc_035508 [Petrolisthes cinctipes]|uniref:Uncharacterized protein n=1 Tax=Petrolisthes cinctipes TaxID=88211 RepID=A0AAE1EMW7_PETCI|nr:hypothetical protein Pcinc_035508 [Petrolisthes cinctipes]